MSSITGTNDLVKQLLPMRFHDFSAVDEPVYCSVKDDALTQRDSIPCIVLSRLLGMSPWQ